MAFNWVCPHCGIKQTVVDRKTHYHRNRISVGGNAEGQVGFFVLTVGCSNEECEKITVTFNVTNYHETFNDWEFDPDATPLFHRTVVPKSGAKPQPDCVPTPLVEDYTEACLICQDSPKAAATLARRCIQGMIRDFCGITKGTLIKEIEALRSALDDGRAPPGVTHETVEAIDHVRSIGNIGAHMEKEIDLIVPVDPDEAQHLISLIEMLFDEWYVARDNRSKRLAEISRIGAEKRQIIADGKTASGFLASPKQA